MGEMVALPLLPVAVVVLVLVVVVVVVLTLGTRTERKQQGVRHKPAAQTTPNGQSQRSPT